MADEERLPAEVFPPGEYIRDEIKARGLTEREFEMLLFSIGCTPVEVVACQFAAYVDDPGLILDEHTARCLGRAFGVSPELFLNLDKAWRKGSASAPAPTTHER